MSYILWNWRIINLPFLTWGNLNPLCCMCDTYISKLDIIWSLSNKSYFTSNTLPFLTRGNLNPLRCVCDTYISKLDIIWSLSNKSYFTSNTHVCPRSFYVNVKLYILPHLPRFWAFEFYGYIKHIMMYDCMMLIWVWCMVGCLIFYAFNNNNMALRIIYIYHD